MLQALITLDLRFPISSGLVPAQTPADPEHVVLFNHELATFGYTLDPFAMARLGAVDADVFAGMRAKILDTLATITGAGARHQTLFADFPYRNPRERRSLDEQAVIRAEAEANGSPVRKFACGHVVDTEASGPAASESCPLCDGSVAALDHLTRPNAPARPVTPLKVLRAGDPLWLLERAQELLTRQGPLSTVERTLLLDLAAVVTPDPPDRLYKEALPLAYRIFGAEVVRPHLSGATDVLRIAAFVSDPDADLSLASPPRFALTTQVRQEMLGLLESLDGITEDLLRHAGPWKRFMRHVHVGQARYRRRYPKTVAAFDCLRSDPAGIATYNRTAERALRAGHVDGAFLAMLARRPGSYLRRFDEILRTARGDVAKEAIATLERVAPQAPARLVIGLKKHVERRQRPIRTRIFLPKGKTNRIQVKGDHRPGIDPNHLRAAQSVLDGVLATRFRDLPALGRVYLDPTSPGSSCPTTGAAMPRRAVDSPRARARR